MQQTFRLVIDCPDQIGLVASVSQFLADHNATIVEASHHTDLQTGRFFMRPENITDTLKLDHQSFMKEFTPLANEYQMNWKLSDSSKRQRVALLASLESHCLVDLLHRWHTGELHCDIPVIIGNHPQMKQFADWYKVPFHWVDFKALGKEAAFAQITTLLQEYKIDLTVLARFMQILPDTLCQELQGKAINIHHSFLPSF
ncbi:MAG: formyltetrahydrofolate deformylase, partial [Pseudomonadota bacterium]|nr:formyltetrahydrofolate deformylase [Pseudomonadota bacterium]